MEGYLEDYFIIKYDDLLDPMKRINTLKEAIDFMNVSYLSSSVTK